MSAAGLQGREVVASFEQSAAARAFVEDGVNREALRTAGVEADEFSGHPEFPKGGRPHRTSEWVIRYGRVECSSRESESSQVADAGQEPRRFDGGRQRYAPGFVSLAEDAPTRAFQDSMALPAG